MASVDDLKRIAEIEFSDIVKTTFFIDHKLRIILSNNSFIDVNLSRKLPDRFGFHWEKMDNAGSIFRYDNVPDKKWKNVSSFPYHFHRGNQKSVETSPFPLTIIDGFRAFLHFVKKELK